MTFMQLQYLLEIHKTGSISQASKSLMISQPNISLTLKALEKELGYPIFQRTRKGLIPTAQGTEVIEHATHICERYSLLTQPILQNTRTLRISSIAFTPTSNAFLRLFRESGGKRDITFSLTQERNHIEKLCNFTLEISIAVILRSYFHHYLDTVKKNGLSTEVIATLPGSICIGKGHPQYQNPSVRLDDLKDDILLDGFGASVSRALKKAGLADVKPENTVICNNTSTRNQLISQGLAYEVTYYNPAQEEYRYIPVDNLTYSLVITTNPLHPPMAEADRFIELLKEEVKAAGLSQCE